MKLLAMCLAASLGHAASQMSWDSAGDAAFAEHVAPPACEPPEVEALGGASFGWLRMTYSRDDATSVSAQFVGGSGKYDFDEEKSEGCASVSLPGVQKVACSDPPKADEYRIHPGGWLVRSDRADDISCPIAVEALLPRSPMDWARDPATTARRGSLRQAMRVVRTVGDVQHAITHDIAISTKTSMEMNIVG